MAVETEIPGGTAAAGPSALTPSAFAWATKPAVGANPFAIVRMTDVGAGQAGTGGGTHWFSNGTRYKLLNNSATIDKVDTANVGVAGTTPQNLTPNAVAIPAGAIQNFDRLCLEATLSKSGASETATIVFRLGSTRTVADAAIATIPTLAGGNLSWCAPLTFERINATTIQRTGNGDPSASYSGASVGAYAAQTTINTSMDSTPMYLTAWVTLSGAVEVPTLQDLELELHTSDS